MSLRTYIIDIADTDNRTEPEWFRIGRGVVSIQAVQRSGSGTWSTGTLQLQVANEPSFGFSAYPSLPELTADDPFLVADGDIAPFARIAPGTAQANVELAVKVWQREGPEAPESGILGSSQGGLA